MRPLFVRVYVALVLVLLVGAVAIVILAPPPERELARHVHVMTGIWPAEVAARLAVASDDAAELRALSAEVGHPVALLPEEAVIDALGVTARRALAEGQPVVMMRGSGPAVYVPVPARALVAELLPDRPQLPLHRGPQGVLVGLLVLVGLSLSVYLIVRPLEGQLTAIAAVAERIGAGELGARVTVSGDDAAGRLATQLNGMADRVQTMVDGRKTLLHGVSHELRTPLARLRFALELIEMADTAEDRGRRLHEAAGDLDELEGLVRELLQFSQLESDGGGDRRPTEAEPLLRAIAEDAQRLRADITVTFEPLGALGEVALDARLFQRAIGNLVNNAVRYADGAVRVSARTSPGRFEVWVDDDGPGVPADMREQIFDPFVRLDAARSRDTGGTGLGLAIAGGCARQHRGSLTVGDSELGGARFCWAMPLGY